MKKPDKNNTSEHQSGGTKSSDTFKTGKEFQKQRGISNSGGQMSHQTDNKQATVNKGNVNSMVQGKTKAPKMPSKHSPKKD